VVPFTGGGESNDLYSRYYSATCMGEIIVFMDIMYGVDNIPLVVEVSKF